MTRLTALLLLALALTAPACHSHHAHARNQAKMSTSVIRHVVLFKFKADATAEQIKSVETAFAALPAKIKEIRGFEWGTNNSPEGLDQGLTHAFLVTFNDAAAREVYLKHPVHQEFVSLLLPVLDKAVVVDYSTKLEGAASGCCASK